MDFRSFWTLLETTVSCDFGCHEARDYLSLGHDFDGNYDSWILRRGGDEVLLSGGDPEFFHDRNVRGLDFKGRIDHDKRAISVVGEAGSEERLDYLVSVLESDYPGYAIWLFGRGSPRRLG